MSLAEQSFYSFEKLSSTENEVKHRNTERKIFSTRPVQLHSCLVAFNGFFDTLIDFCNNCGMKRFNY